MNSRNQYNKNTNKLAGNVEKLSSGYQINRAGDNASGLAMSEKMRSQVGGLDVAARNTEDAISLVKVAEGACQEIHDMLNRMTELSTQSANGTYVEEDRAALGAEFDELKSEIDRISDSSNFNGIYVFGEQGETGELDENGELKLSDIQLQVGDTSEDYHQLNVPRLSMTHTAMGLEDTDVTTQEGAAAAIDAIVNSINYVSNHRADLGALQNRLDVTTDNISSMEENMTAAESQIRDTNVAKEMMSFTANQVVSQASQSMLAHAQQQPQSVINLMM